jgi:hypothetical protein
MNTSDYSDAQLLWKMFYAGECFRQARGAAQHILDAKLERDSTLFYPLVTAVYVLYAKPFTRADAVGKLGDEIIPAENRELHNLLLGHRHQVYAHRDGDGFSVADYGPVNQVRAVRLPHEIRLMATDFHARFPAMPAIIDLCQTLEKKTGYHVGKLWTRHAKSIPDKVGEYMLNVQDSSAAMWVSQKPMVLTKQT